MAFPCYFTLEYKVFFSFLFFVCRIVSFVLFSSLILCFFSSSSQLSIPIGEWNSNSWLHVAHTAVSPRRKENTATQLNAMWAANKRLKKEKFFNRFSFNFTVEVKCIHSYVTKNVMTTDYDIDDTRSKLNGILTNREDEIKNNNCDNLILVTNLS